MNPAQQRIKRWRESPISFVREEFGVEPDAWQRELLEVFPSQDKDKIRISLQACTGPGKTAALAWCGWNFLVCYGDRAEHPKGVAVSITGDNLADNLWPEFSKWQARSEFLKRAFMWTKSRIFAVDHPETWFMAARSFARTANAEEQGRTLSGLHSKYVLVLIDESGDIPIAVMKAAEQALGNCAFAKVIQAGNPTSHDGMLYAAATRFRDLWYIIRITGDPDDPNRSPRIDIDNARKLIKTFGRSDPWIMATILGEFPPSSINTLLGPDEVGRALGRHLTSDQYEFSQKRLGVDVARFGDDRTVLFPRQGLASFKPEVMRGARTHEIAARVAQAKAKWNYEIEMVDGSGGYGAGVIDSLLQAGHNPMEVQFGGKAIKSRYANKRAEMWFEMADWIKRGGALPNLSELGKELTAPTYTFRDGRLMLEPKEQIKKRLGFSPDMADALALTFALPDQPGNLYLPGVTTRDKVLSEYDPFEDA